MSNQSIILVAPQMGENIGAAARAMKNFGLSDLRIVSPRDGWPNPKAEAMAVGAIDLIHNASIYTKLEDAIGDREYIYATTAQPRDMNKNYVTLKNLNERYPQDTKVGIMFGRESSGLTNEEIALANEIITIDTTSFSSLNIGQAVMLICYELFKAPKRDDLENKQELCSKAEMQYFFDHLLGELDKTRFFRAPERVVYMKQSIMSIFNRVDKLSHNDIQTLRGVVAALTSNSGI